MGVAAAIDRFRSMLEDPPRRMPSVMPMTVTVAPHFAERHPDAAAVFDNLHAMHDVVSDILASPVVPRPQKRTAILAALARYRDESADVMTPEEWREMGAAMGLDRMGGPSPAGGPVERPVE